MNASLSHAPARHPTLNPDPQSSPSPGRPCSFLSVFVSPPPAPQGPSPSARRDASRRGLGRRSPRWGCPWSLLQGHGWVGGWVASGQGLPSARPQPAGPSAGTTWGRSRHPSPPTHQLPPSRRPAPCPATPVPLGRHPPASWRGACTAPAAAAPASSSRAPSSGPTWEQEEDGEGS